MLPTFQQLSNQSWMMLQNSWKQQVDPVLSAKLAGIVFLTGIALKNGATAINHGLGRKPQGWFLTDINGAATIYRSADFNDLTLTLTSNAAVTVSLGVF